MSIGHLCVFEEVSIQVLFVIRLFVFLVLCSISSLYILENNPLSHVSLMVSFAVQKPYVYFSFVSLAWGDRLAETLLQEMSAILLLMFSSRNFMVL